MRDFLLDLVEHSYDLGCIDLIKITGNDKETTIDGLAEDKSVVLQAKFKTPVAEFMGTFGMPNLGKLSTILGIPEYKENAKITLTKQDRNGQSIPVGLHFENAAGDFKNDYRYMLAEIVNDKLKSVKFKGAKWGVDVVPTVASITRLRYQAQANSEEQYFTARTNNGNLEFSFGDHSTHSGNFVFHPGVNGNLKRAWAWPAKQFASILDLMGDKTVRISDDGAAKITVDSGIAVYNYIIPAQSK